MVRHSRRRSFLGLILAAVLLAACGPSAGPSPSASVSASASNAVSPTPDATEAPASPPASVAAIDLPTSGRIELRDRGYALTLPDNWFTVDLSEEGIQDVLAEGLQGMPEGFGESLTEQVRTAISGGVSLLAYRNADGNAAAGTNVNVILLPAYGMSLDTIEALNVAQLEQIVGEGATVDSERVMLPAGEAAVLRYELAPSSAGDGVAIEQYFFVGEDNQLVLTCTVPGNGSSIGEECGGIADTVEFLP
jgi:hypothetical protein